MAVKREIWKPWIRQAVRCAQRYYKYQPTGLLFVVRQCDPDKAKMLLEQKPFYGKKPDKNPLPVTPYKKLKTKKRTGPMKRWM